jgi:ATP synthase protein I
VSDGRDSPAPRVSPPATLADRIGAKADRKLRARRDGAPGVFFGLGMLGLVGWSVVVPTLAGAALGGWLDRHHAGTHSWTLALLVAGLAIGCLNAWHWVSREDRAMHDDEGHGDA